MKKVVLALAMTMMTSQAFAGFGTRGGRLAPLAVVIKFASFGSGADQRVVAQVNEIVEQQKKQGLIAMVTTTPWGREGEFDLCVEYKNFNDAYRYEQQFSAIASHATKAPVTVERTLNCGGDRPVSPTRR